ncbi:hypothetical protein GFM13_18270 [Rhizobium leguminosarum bv. viciae]|nr:hypothetical protein [Rhizobium leguminosarum bv. viciae]
MRHLRHRSSLEHYQLVSEMKGSRPCAGFFAPYVTSFAETNDRAAACERGSATIDGQQFMRLGGHAQ